MTKGSVLQLAEEALTKYRQEPSRGASLNSEYETSIRNPTDLPSDLEVFNPSLQELADYLEEEWDRNCENIAWLLEARKMLQERRMVDAGVVPALVYGSGSL